MIYYILVIFYFLISSAWAQDVGNTSPAESPFSALRADTRATVSPQNIADINAELRPHDIIYMPDGDGPFPVVLFFHGCSGRTLSHERDWADRMVNDKIAMISVDSYSGRNIKWQDACDFKKMIPWQRATDVIATISYAKTLDKIDNNNIYLAGFSHGAMTVWAAQVFASDKRAPIGMENWPKSGFSGVKGSFIFYGPCMEPWTADVATQVFLGDKDRYIDETSCVNYQKKHPKNTGSFNLTIYPGATHTFDHAEPNQANIEAGSLYDEAATLDAWQKIKKMILSP